jgi:hypothetical protein
MTHQTVSQAYLMGIHDERELLQQERDEFARDPLGFASEMLASAQLTLAQGFSGEMAEYMRGSRDFWANQVRNHR